VQKWFVAIAKMTRKNGSILSSTMHGLRQKSIGNARMVDESCASIVGTLRKCDEYACKGRLLAKPN
jgi:hypothetical protein